MNFGKYFPFTFIIVILALFFYSFTQVDLSLTFSKFPLLHSVEMAFKGIGYFQRPTSTGIYLIITSLMFLYFAYFINLSIKNKLKISIIWKILIATSIILSFSYIAFSHDLFNYIFDAKILTYYHQNPYVHKALDFPNDPMLSFMHWTHRLYPYGPFWLAITAPFSLLALNKFIISFFLFKFIATAFYLGSVYLIYKINKKINPGSEVVNTVLFAFNPLIIIESLVSSHNDIAMVFFALLGIYAYFLNKKILGFIIIFLSSQIKIPTIALLFPAFLGFIPFKNFKFGPREFVLTSVVLMTTTFFAALTRYEIQPWYILWIFPFVALLKPNKYIVSLIFGISIGLLLRYTVFLYSGNWDGELVLIRNSLTLVSIAISLVVGFVWSRKDGYSL